VDGRVYFVSDNLHVVEAGVDGSSMGSRVLSGTFGHHNSLRAGGSVGGRGLSGFTAVTALFASAAVIASLLRDTQDNDT
jgi:hypothetical protein